MEPSSPCVFLSAAATAASPGSHRRIAIAIDLSDESAYAVKWAVQNYLHPGDAIILLHVRPTSVLYGSDWGAIDLSVKSEGAASEVSPQKLEEDFDAFTTTKAQDLAQPFVEAQIPFKIHIVKDHDMKERLCLEVEMLGSVSDYCVHHCVCPVVVVRYPDDTIGLGSGAVGSSSPLANGSKVPVGKDTDLHALPEEEQEYHDADEHKGTFNDLNHHQITALGSCFIQCDKSNEQIQLRKELAKPLQQLQDSARRIAQIQRECKLDIDVEEYVEATSRPYLMDVIYCWSKGASFAEVIEMTDIFEGSIIRLARRLDEFLNQIMGYKIFTHEIHSSYAARIDNFRSYGTISKDILQRWAYPLVPNFQYFGISSKVKLDRRGVYKAPDVVQSRSAQIGAITLIGSGTTIGNHTIISNSVVGRGCTIGNNVCIDGCYIWDNVIIEDDCRLNHAIVCDGVHLSAGVVLEPGVILSFKVEVGRLITIPAYSKVSLRPQPSIQDSDEELEYADASSAVIESPSITSMCSNRNAESTPDYSAHEVGIAGVGYIWSTYEGEHEEEWRHSIAPIPEAKLTELSHAYHEEPDVPYQDVNDTLVSGELKPDSESTGFDDGDGGDYGDSADFDKEVEATFHRALAGVNQETVILEINSLRLSCNKSHADCAGALFFSVMELGLEAPRSSNSELYQNIAKEINKWKDLLKHYLKSVDEEIEVILKFEEICLETATELAPLFSIILSYLYEKDILSEDAILSWASEKEGADESDKIFVKQSESFITWLKEASEEEDEDNDDE